MIDYNRVAKRIFNVLKGHSYQLKMYTVTGQGTVDPEEGRHFFVSEPNMLITLDDSNGEIKLNKTSKVELSVYEDALTQLKNLANHYMLRFSIKNYGKAIKPKDFSYQAKKNKKDKEMNNVAESKMYGSKRSSYQVIENVKVLVRHRTDVDEDIRGSRSRNIQAIFLENSNGERLRFPTNHLSAARAMARHISKGGNMQDKIGEHIISSSRNYSKLYEFMRYVTNNKLITENTNEIITTIRENLINIATELKQFAGSRSYDLASSRIAESNTVDLNEEELNNLKELFTVKRFDEKFTEVLPIVNQLMHSQQNILTQIQEAAQKEILVLSLEALEENGIEYISKASKFGNKILTISSRMVENKLLSSYLSKVGKKYIEEGKVSAFEENIVKSVLGNIKVVKEEQKEGVFESVLNSFASSFDKYQYSFILENLQNTITEDFNVSSIIPELRDLGNRLKRIEALAKDQGLLEYEGDKPKLIELGHAIFQYEAAKKGLGIVNKLKDPMQRKKHASRVMGNLNKLRLLVTRLEAKLGIDQK